MPWQTEDLKRLIEVEARLQGVDPRLALAVATQESYLNPNAKGDNGRSLGLFQLQEAAATDAGIDPARRGEVPLNVEGGVRYLKLKLDQSGGNVPQALSRYNRGTPDYRGIGDPDYERNVMRFYEGGATGQQGRGTMQRVTNFFSPASAEAAEPKMTTFFQSASAPAPATTNLAGRSRLEEIEAELARRDAQTSQPTPQSTPQPPTARSTPEQDAAYRASVGQQPAAPAPTATPQEAQATLARMRTRQAEAATPESRLARFQQLPAITALSPEERQAAIAEFQGYTEAQQRAFLASEPAADLPTAVQEGPRPTPEQQLRPQLKPSAAEPALEEGITKPSTMIPLLMPGAGMRTLPEAIRQGTGMVARAARPIVEGLSQTLGWGTGRTLETGQVPSPGEVVKEAAWNIGTSAVPEVVGAGRDAWGGLLRTTPGGQRLLNQQAVREADGLGQRVFNAEDKAAVSQVFDAVAASRVKLDVTPVRDYWQGLIPEERRLALRELNDISPAFVQALNNPRIKGWDIGDLQHLRSELIKSYNKRQTPAVKDLLIDMRSKVDDAIAAGKAVGSVPIGTNAETLQRAQAAWHKVKQAEDLQSLVTKHTHRSGRELRAAELNLSALDKDLRGGGTRAAQRLVGSMNQTEKEALQAEMKTLSRKYPFLHISDTGAKITEWGSLISAMTNLAMGNVPGSLASVMAFMVTAAARSPRIMGLLSNSIVESRGRLTPTQVDTILNAIRHEQQAPSGTGQ